MGAVVDAVVDDMNLNWYNQVPWPGLMADVILGVHLLIALFVVFGQVAVLIGWAKNWRWVRNFWFRITHLITIGFIVIQTWLGQLCPLTIWEQQLRQAAGQAFHDQSFVQYWLSRLLFFDLPWWVFIVVYTAFVLLVLVSWWRLPPRWPTALPIKF